MGVGPAVSLQYFSGFHFRISFNISRLDAWDWDKNFSVTGLAGLFMVHISFCQLGVLEILGSIHLNAFKIIIKEIKIAPNALLNYISTREYLRTRERCREARAEGYNYADILVECTFRAIEWRLAQMNVFSHYCLTFNANDLRIFSKWTAIGV